MVIWVVTDRGQELSLGPRLDSGGEGVVYEVNGRPELVAKLLLRAADRQATYLRLDALRRHRRTPRIVLSELADPGRTAWPIAMITTVGGDYLGYLMPDLRARFRSLDYVLVPELRREQFPAATWATSLAAAGSLANLVADLHTAGYVIGDLKKENLWVDDHARVAISDVDSFQFTDQTTGFFPCTSRTAGYTAPEGIAGTEPRLDESSDNFVLAILVHQLLMAGMHPFFGQPADGSPYVSYDDNVRAGRARLIKPESVIVRPGDPPASVLPASLRNLFRQCFGDTGRSDRSARPTATAWLASLRREAAADRLRRCERVPGHVHTAERRLCPWCELSAEGLDPYPASRLSN
jgi:DNA-binding helix-hairpin-helix protein with protein kinase domain